MSTHTDTPAELLGTETIQDVVHGAPGRNWSYVAAPGSQTCTNKTNIKNRSGDKRKQETKKKALRQWGTFFLAYKLILEKTKYFSSKKKKTTTHS